MLISAVPVVAAASVSMIWVSATSPSPSPSPTVVPIDPARVTPGLLGLASLLFLAVAVFVIWKSMNKQLKKIDFDEDAAPAE